jgi:hypothetical protein
MSKKNYRKVVLTHYGAGNDPGIVVTVEVMSYQTELTEPELDKLANHLADNSMYAIAGAPFVHVPLNKIQVKRPRK